MYTPLSPMVCTNNTKYKTLKSMEKGEKKDTKKRSRPVTRGMSGAENLFVNGSITYTQSRHD